MEFLKNIFNSVVAFAYFALGIFLHMFVIFSLVKFCIPLHPIEDALLVCLSLSATISFEGVFGYFWWSYIPDWILENM